MNHTNAIPFYPTTLVDWVAIAAGVATVIVIIFLYFQMRSTDQSNKLAYCPLLIIRRTVITGGQMVLMMANIGNGSAKEIIYNATDVTNVKELHGKTIPYIKAGEERPLQIVWKSGRRVLVVLGYQDVTGKQYNFTDIFDF